MTSTPSLGYILLIILPNCEAAAVITTHFYFRCFTTSSIARAVNGLITHIAPCSKVVSSDKGKHYYDLTRQYCEYDPWPYFSTANATFFPTRPQPINPPPLSTTIPEPSNPITVGNFFWCE